MRRYWITAMLVLLLLNFQAQLWLGRGSLPDVWSLERTLDDLNESNAQAELRNAQLANEIRDLQSGLEVVEAEARSTLGMVKPNELFIQYTQVPKGAPASTR